MLSNLIIVVRHKLKVSQVTEANYDNVQHLTVKLW